MLLIFQSTPHTKNLNTAQDSLNTVTGWIALLLHIWEAPGLNLGLQTGYPD
jgi:hypothetical protein